MVLKQVMFNREIEKRSIIVSLPVKTDGYPDAAHDLQIFFVDNRRADSRGEKGIEGAHRPTRAIDVILDGTNPFQH